LPHILLNSTALFFGRDAYDQLVRRVQTPAWHILDVLVILGVSFHLFNGVRVIMTDFLNVSRSQRVLAWGVA